MGSQVQGEIPQIVLWTEERVPESAVAHNHTDVYFACHHRSFIWRRTAIKSETHIGAPDWAPRGPNEEQKEEEHEKRNQYCEGCYHPLIQWNGSNESLPRPVGLGLNEEAIQPDSLNVAGFSECGWPGVFLRSHRWFHYKRKACLLYS